MNFANYWGNIMGMPEPQKYKCLKCHMAYDTATALASHLQKHRFLPRHYNLSESDKNFLRANRIQPWPDEQGELTK
jgi:hypothetical protein